MSTASDSSILARVATPLLLLLLAGLTGLVGTARAGSTRVEPQAEQIARGQYIFNAAGCLGCHTDEIHVGQRLAGGREILTSYGAFFTPNITPDPIYGIGNWSDSRFIRAMRRGISADGTMLLPVFPYTSYTLMDDTDILNLKAYLMTQAPVTQPNRPHQLRDSFTQRLMMPGWNLIYLKSGPLVTNPRRSAQWNRGQYLVQALTHCGECHTPRTWSGALNESRAFAGNPHGINGENAPNITPDPESGLGKWSDADLLLLLEIGLLPDGDIIGGSMAEMVRHSTSRLTLADRKAIVAYLRALPPLPSEQDGSTK
ncbi:MAG: cytochrome c [Rhodospirillaceae bacterium]